MILDKLKKFFKLDGDVDLSRRRVIKTVGALAALTAVGGAVPLLSKVNELKKQIVDGQVYGQTFYLTEPIIIDIPNVIISNCEFIAVEPMPYMLQFKEGANNCLIKDCHFNANNMITSAIIKIEPQPQDYNNFSFQSAIDAAASSDNKTVQLSSGIYKFSGAIELPENDGSYIGTKFKV
jgi:hypothetical protein